MEIHLFEDLPLSPELQRGLKKMGFHTLTPIQAEAIPFLFQGRDVIGQAQTGTGKTAAFGVPMLMKMDITENYIQGLVLTPTRELAEQVFSHLKSYARYMYLRISVLHGGSNVYRQMEILEKSSPHLVVGTPGRIIELIKKRKTLDLSKVKVVVIDEADKMLERGFIRDIEFILSKIPYVRQTSLWSATLSSEILGLATRYMRHPRKVLVSKNEVAQTMVDQYYIRVISEAKEEVLYHLLKELVLDRAIIFCNTRESTDLLALKLQSEEYLAVSLHGSYTQSQRDEALRDFKLRKIKYLVSTDVAGRGLDILDIPHIINYDVPEDPEVYFHRIGRTGRMGETGMSITLVTSEDEPFFQRIIEMTDTKIKEMFID